jgi:thymidylate kinase
MKIIVLEGSSASGKTTTAKLLLDALTKKGKSARVIEEDLTLMPILNNRDSKISLDHLMRVIKTAFEGKFDFIIFDRLHLTASAITASNLSEYFKIEDELLNYHPLLVLLTIPQNQIPKRIRESIKFRNASWGEYVRKKGSDQEINEHYIEAQKKVIKQFKDSGLPKIQFDTSDKNYGVIAGEIIKKVL